MSLMVFCKEDTEMNCHSHQSRWNNEVGDHPWTDFSNTAGSAVGCWGSSFGFYLHFDFLYKTKMKAKSKNRSTPGHHFLEGNRAVVASDGWNTSHCTPAPSPLCRPHSSRYRGSLSSRVKARSVAIHCSARLQIHLVVAFALVASASVQVGIHRILMLMIPGMNTPL